jgi:hypothetical protein
VKCSIEAARSQRDANDCPTCLAQIVVRIAMWQRFLADQVWLKKLARLAVPSNHGSPAEASAKSAVLVAHGTAVNVPYEPLGLAMLVHRRADVAFPRALCWFHLSLRAAYALLGERLAHPQVSRAVRYVLNVR